MSPTSYQAAPPRIGSVTEQPDCVKLSANMLSDFANPVTENRQLVDFAGVGLVRQGREFLQEEKDIREGRGGASGGGNRGECGAPTPRGAEDFNCSGDSTGIRLSSNNKLVRQSLSQIAKTERTISEVAANLAM